MRLTVTNNSQCALGSCHMFPIQPEVDEQNKLDAESYNIHLYLVINKPPVYYVVALLNVLHSY